MLNHQKVSKYYEHDSGFCDKCEGICDNSDPENQFSRPDNQLSAIDIVTNPSEIRQDTSLVLGNVQGANGIIFGAHKTDRLTHITGSGISSSQNIVTISTKKCRFRLYSTVVLSAKYSFGANLQTGTY